ncbi:hypothetical protein JWS72_002908 [Enterococcus faecalis]|uniref:hypothetical protein n=1 Tax=Enterococcus faecalis TaxID=1351 RepID=UPI00098D0D02|nr:hypothetical protein [Enterococcus faecalis]MDF4035857.1 hypothetical protein [Staphylococcus aureus]EGO2510932.1 hypothetical protein [Enterococcus faecalis]EGO5060708.1 hypothetical protein [Enterococcus faecalis]EHB6442925.1 hypothetical protein [Enterococcus faecalis]EHE8493672.1 hypothetical protein [Enterococcus faecalis]
MNSRKKYDYNGIEITNWNQGNIVFYVQCDCGQLARREYGKNEHFKCSLCKREYQQKLGAYVLIEQ